MLLNEFFDADRAGDRLTNLIDFVSNDGETELIRQRLIQKGIKPTLRNNKKHLLRMLTMPLDEVPDPERTIILRSGRPERFGIREPRIRVPVGSKGKNNKAGGAALLQQLFPLIFSAP